MRTTISFHYKETRCLQVSHHAQIVPLQRNPVSPGFPSCPMSSVSAWSTAAAVRGTTARAIHESPVISALQRFSGVLSFFCFCIYCHSGLERRNVGIPTIALECLFLHCLGLAGKGLLPEAAFHDLLPSTI